MKSFKLEKLTKKEVAVGFLLSLIASIFIHQFLLVSAISGIVLLVMIFAKKEKL